MKNTINIKSACELYYLWDDLRREEELVTAIYSHKEKNAAFARLARRAEMMGISVIFATKIAIGVSNNFKAIRRYDGMGINNIPIDLILNKARGEKRSKFTIDLKKTIACRLEREAKRRQMTSYDFIVGCIEKFIYDIDSLQ